VETGIHSKGVNDGFYDEYLKGGRKGQRPSRLRLQYHVIYVVESKTITAKIREISPRKYLDTIMKKRNEEFVSVQKTR
jgi:hypothetical protein